MGTNSSKYDLDAEYAKKSLKELNEMRVRVENVLQKYPELNLLNEFKHLQYIKLCIAERIGK